MKWGLVEVGGKFVEEGGIFIGGVDLEVSSKVVSCSNCIEGI